MKAYAMIYNRNGVLIERTELKPDTRLLLMPWMHMMRVEMVE